jgi:hypothetical protein
VKPRVVDEVNGALDEQGCFTGPGGPNNDL